MRKPSASTVVIALLLGVLLGVGFSNIVTAKSSAEVYPYSYSGFAFVDSDTGTRAIDLNNGDMWDVVPSMPDREQNPLRSVVVPPRYLGNLHLERVADAKKKALENLRR